jgi:hypothetical protein
MAVYASEEDAFVVINAIPSIEEKSHGSKCLERLKGYWVDWAFSLLT